MTRQACIFNIQKFSLHDGPGIRTVVFFKGCPLRCYWCSNPESQQLKPEKMWSQKKKEYILSGEYRTIDSIFEEVISDLPFYESSGGGVTLSGGEVLTQAEAAIELLTKLKNANVHTASETSGHAKLETFARFIKKLDLLYFDVKHYHSEKHKQGTGVSNELIMANLSYALNYAKKSSMELVVRTPIIPGFNDSLEDAENFSKFYQSLGIKRVELLPFHQFGANKYNYLNREYSLKNATQLTTEDLTEHKKILENMNITCQVH